MFKGWIREFEIQVLVWYTIATVPWHSQSGRSAAMMAGTMMRASKLASYGVIFSALLTQLAFAKVLMGEDDEVEGPIDVTNSKDWQPSNFELSQVIYADYTFLCK